MASEVAGYGELEFDLPSALLRSLVTTLDGLDKVSLVPENTLSIPDEQGVYHLFHGETPVYVGKTDGRAGLASRLTRHSRKVLHRRGLDPNEVMFKAVRVYVFTAVDIEGDLIRHYGGVKGLPWNGSGFGSNDPGRERDTTKNKPNNFDALYPIDIDRPVDFDLESMCSGAEALNAIRAKLPYTFRVARRGGGQKLDPDLEGRIVDCNLHPMSAREAIASVVRQLPPGWQATKLLGYVILYKEDRSYPDAEVIARSEGSPLSSPSPPR